jgi:hypothetical protein
MRYRWKITSEQLLLDEVQCILVNGTHESELEKSIKAVKEWKLYGQKGLRIIYFGIPDSGKLRKVMSNIELRMERQLLDIISSIDNIGRFVMYVGGTRSPHRKPALSESRPLYHMRNGFDRVQSNPWPQTWQALMLISNIDTVPLQQPRQGDVVWWFGVQAV